MASNDIYKITLTNWSTHNKAAKKHFKKSLIDNNFTSDSNLGTLPVAVRWLFLDMILTCGDHARDTIEMTERQLRVVLESSWSIPRALDALQSLQLLTYTKISKIGPYDLLREKKRREEKRREVANDSESKQIALLDDERKVEPATQDSKVSVLHKRATLALNVYSKAFIARYKAKPYIGGKEMNQLRYACKNLSDDKVHNLLQVYLQMEDPWFLKKKHDIQTFIGNLNKIAVSFQTGEDDDENPSDTWLREKLKEMEAGNDNLSIPGGN